MKKPSLAQRADELRERQEELSRRMGGLSWQIYRVGYESAVVALAHRLLEMSKMDTYGSAGSEALRAAITEIDRLDPEHPV